MLTPTKIQELSDPIESVYIHMTDELLINIGKHLTSPTWTHTGAWEVQKLAELGQLNEENAKIINKWIKTLPKEVRDTMEATRREALENLEKQMEKAVASGKLPPPVTDSTVQLLQDYEAQAADKLNLVNTTMLQSSENQYVRGVQLTQELMNKSQGLLNDAAGNVVTGVETRNTALRRVIGVLADEGVTGFVDRAGRTWSPEAYVNMDVRTTVHNVAIQATKTRMEDYGVEVFQYSSHAAARPLCYPIQGQFFSWDGSEGEIELGNGRRVHYEPFSSVEGYNTPAGPFGINCGHFPIPVIPGVSIPHGDDNIQSPGENKKAYAESQEQRRLEREIREKKRLVEMAGDTATKEDKQAVRDAQEAMRDFIKQTGRTRRYEREQIFGGGK